MKLDTVIEVESLLGESPLWDGRLGLLYWIDIHGESLGVLDYAGGEWVTHPTGRRFGSVALTMTPGRLLAATATGLELIDVTMNAYLEIGRFDHPEADMPDNRFNDGKTDRQGRFWAGTMEDAEADNRTGSMYRLDDAGVERQWGDIGIPNGLCFSPDGDLMYTADSMDRALWVAEYDVESGTPGPRRDFAAVAEGFPDGSTVDVEGGIWNAQWGASKLTRYSPGAAVMDVLEIPATKPTCPAFGGPDLDKLFITTARTNGRGGQHGGSILVYDVGVTGLPEVPATTQL